MMFLIGLQREKREPEALEGHQKMCQGLSQSHDSESLRCGTFFKRIVRFSVVVYQVGRERFEGVF